MSFDDIVSLKQLADALGMDRSHARRYILRQGFRPVKRRTPDSGGMLALTLTREESERLVALRKDQGFFSETPGKPISEEEGFFYIIQLIPEYDPNRVKLGFATTLEDRLSQHRTSAPTATVRSSWPCRKAWEQTVISAITAVNCRLILNEVYECDSIEDLVGRGNAIFSLLPSPDYLSPLARSSPLLTEEGKVAEEEDATLEAEESDEEES